MQTRGGEPAKVSRSLNRCGNQERDWGRHTGLRFILLRTVGFDQITRESVPGRRDRNVTNMPTSKRADAETEEEQPGVFKL